MAGEVITIQAGSFANFTGAHYWNFQGQPIFTPRLVLFDLCGSLGGASQSSLEGAEQATPAVTTWSGPVTVHRAEPLPRSRFAQQLEVEPDEAPAGPSGNQEIDAAYDAISEAARELDREGAVRSWTDFLKVRLHPRSLALLPGRWQGAAEFSGFGHGRGALASDEAREDAADRIRGFAEECDSLQARHGFQYFVDDLSGFGHFSYELLQMMQDDYARSPVLLFALRPSLEETSAQPASVLRQRRLSEAASMARLSEVSSLHIPIAPSANLPCVRWRPGNVFHASALCASVIDTATLPYRLTRTPRPGPLGVPVGGCHLRSLTELLGTSQANNYTAAFAAVPCPDVPEAHAAAAAADARTGGNASSSQPPFTMQRTSSWTPGIPADVEERLAESVTLRGAKRGGHPLRADEAAQALDAALLQEGANGRQNGGSSGQHSRLHQNDGPASIPVLARLCASPAAADVAKTQLERFRGLVGSGGGMAVLQGWGYTADDVTEIEERLLTMASAYDHDDDC
ncbi:tubulin nucleotide-binding domain-like protein [Coccomyxa subellipsoidea C-169]|uniref:Tubulin nucleotide-binding domain-like protein n=1 Tax=Coccomyxa subellipsoidea (strain C-169) TaxID=574566 RepID=I0YMJ6_COCSC|nr:tubulin nucleotide-binding domain-like protein [Coccomyxa subellipsoidea C-169]EIE19615.1 tubulin nucleotide-binding domain-like protein [Coccomyxa subellipsoidea C-169]|eukprot:XP_005644159.1 tubulin nucleotide-binding domain-like protein [Coccomyxa subellipsoidea C-169]